MAQSSVQPVWGAVSYSCLKTGRGWHHKPSILSHLSFDLTLSAIFLCFCSNLTPILTISSSFISPSHSDTPIIFLFCLWARLIINVLFSWSLPPSPQKVRSCRLTPAFGFARVWALSPCHQVELPRALLIQLRLPLLLLLSSLIIEHLCLCCHAMSHQ